MDMRVQYVDHMGTDLTVVNAARVSHDKVSQWKDETVNSLHDKDVRLINYLAEHNHWTPFAHPQVSLRITAPIPIRNQLDKHRVGLAINEISRRYVDDEPDFYMPLVWRSRPEASIKQGSGRPVVEKVQEDVDMAFCSAVQTSAAAYRQMIKAGVCPEQARFVLPQCMMTTFVWTGSLSAYARLFVLRMAPESQQEVRTVASMIGNIVQPLFPVSWAALTKEVRG